MKKYIYALLTTFLLLNNKPISAQIDSIKFNYAAQNLYISPSKHRTQTAAEYALEIPNNGIAFFSRDEKVKGAYFLYIKHVDSLLRSYDYYIPLNAFSSEVRFKATANRLYGISFIKERLNAVVVIDLVTHTYLISNLPITPQLNNIEDFFGIGDNIFIAESAHKKITVSKLTLVQQTKIQPVIMGFWVHEKANVYSANFVQINNSDSLVLVSRGNPFENKDTYFGLVTGLSCNFLSSCKGMFYPEFACYKDNALCLGRINKTTSGNMPTIELMPLVQLHTTIMQYSFYPLIFELKEKNKENNILQKLSNFHALSYSETYWYSLYWEMDVLSSGLPIHVINRYSKSGKIYVSQFHADTTVKNLSFTPFDVDTTQKGFLKNQFVVSIDTNKSEMRVLLPSQNGFQLFVISDTLKISERPLYSFSQQCYQPFWVISVGSITRSVKNPSSPTGGSFKTEPTFTLALEYKPYIYRISVLNDHAVLVYGITMNQDKEPILKIYKVHF
jgi:hypothetical protein